VPGTRRRIGAPETRRLATLAFAAALTTATVHGWGPQGHRLVALVAAHHLTPAATRNVQALLGDETLADVASWADDVRDELSQTSSWHYVNIPAGARRYDRDRDCPRQPGVAAGGRGDRWRDCVVDRIAYNQTRLADRALDRSDRATALKFLVHLIGDLHQPFHAVGVERGGNGISVILFGAEACGSPRGPRFPCNLHGAWDGALIAHRKLSDRAYASELERRIAAGGWTARGSAADWAMESHALATAALLPVGGEVNEGYYRAHRPQIDERLARGGLRLAGALNDALR
jgi:hypothetical protein